MMREGAAATCERCGAPLALAQGGKARCVFCLHAQPLPAHVAQPLAESARLSAELDAAKIAGHASTVGFAVAGAGAALGALLLEVVVDLARADEHAGDLARVRGGERVVDDVLEAALR
ncbi:MAG TPA: hypothetical protein PKA88_37400, partial [Polyangiaceae bacterium]|nr:hypothetical protein [Polyangiaceae bacterium]